MKKAKRLVLLVVSLFMLMQSTPLEVLAIDPSQFVDQEDYYYSFCTGIDLSEQDEAICDQFYEYMMKKSEEAEKELADINKDIENTKKDMNKVQASINKLASQIKDKTTQINGATSAINKLQINIEVLEKQIAEREADIKKRDDTIKARMEAVQSIMQVNAFADFIMGAKDFVDLIRRVEGVNDITNYDKQQIKELEEQKALLVADKEELDKQKKAVEEQKAELEKQKAALQATQKAQQALLAEYHTKEAELEAMHQQKAQNLKEIKGALSDLSSLKKLKPSPGWIYPVEKFYISAGSFYYPASFCSAGANRCPHLGTDFAASVGTPVYAPANSVVLFMSDRCPTYGGLGNWCGTPGSAGAGNHVLLAMVVNGKTYAVKIGHMKSGVSKYVKWPSGDGKAVTVMQGVQIGEVGSSGNSSGPHAHIEVMYFGTQSLESVVNTFANKGQFDFGLGWGSAGLATTCNKRNYKAPCRYNPMEIWNLKLGENYGG